MRYQNLHLACMAIAAMLCSSLAAGNLDPPGSPMPTNPAFDPRVPVNADNTPGNSEAAYRITESGSYILTENLTVSLGDMRHGIRIEADNVTLDLNGFTLGGTDQPTSSGPGDSLVGIICSGEHFNIRVINGIVQGWGDMGIDLSDAVGGEIRDVVAANCGGNGIYSGSSFALAGCVSRGNADHGFSTRPGTSMNDCVAEGNGFYGAFVNGGSTVSNSVFRNNGSSGVITLLPTNILNCVAEGNGSSGFRIQGRGRVEGCVATDNTGDGITVIAGNSTIIGNTCHSNGDGDNAGISVNTGSNCRIEGNNVTSNEDTGIAVNSTGNIIIGNTAADNGTPFDIAAGNAFGSILDVSAGLEITSTIAWRNFIY